MHLNAVFSAANYIASSVTVVFAVDKAQPYPAANRVWDKNVRELVAFAVSDVAKSFAFQEVLLSIALSLDDRTGSRLLHIFCPYPGVTRSFFVELEHPNGLPFIAALGLTYRCEFIALLSRINADILSIG